MERGNTSGFGRFSLVMKFLFCFVMFCNIEVLIVSGYLCVGRGMRFSGKVFQWVYVDLTSCVEDCCTSVEMGKDRGVLS